jgi:superfamily II DNA or RNA helicase
VARVQLYLGGKQDNLICFRGNKAWLPPALRKVVGSYFNSWNALRDITLYQQLKRDLAEAYGTRHFEGTDWERLEQFYNDEMLRLRVVLDGRVDGSAAHFRLQVHPQPARPIVALLKDYGESGGVLRDPFDIWKVEKLLRRAKIAVQLGPGFAAALQTFGERSISFEPSLSFFRQIQAYHASAALAPELKAILEPAMDPQHTLTDPLQLPELAATLRGAGANVRVLAETHDVLSHYARLQALTLTGPDAPQSAVAPVLDDQLKAELYGFQRDGTAFLVHNGRALLADDMGLGKTLQSIAAALYMQRQGKVKRVLVICPASLKYQWQSEIHRFTRERCEVIGGDKAERAAIYKAAKGGSLLASDALPLFYVINYELLQRDLADIEELGADLLILDEAQRIKNFQTKTYQSMLKLKVPYAFVLTGTPLENQLMELYTIMRFVDARALGSNPLTFRDRYVTLDRFGSVTGYQNVAEVTRKLSSLVLRRTREEKLADLPPLIEQEIWLTLTDVQRRIYRELRGEARELLSDSAWDKAKTNNAMVLLQRLREVCDTPELLDPTHTESQKLTELADVLTDEVGTLGRRAIVFTQWTRMGEILQRELRAAGYETRFLHGGLEAKARTAVVADFQTGPAQILISTDAGGVGLNLQNASLVVNFDLPFNPAKLAQRIGRAWRLGQQNTVVVKNLLCRATVEENLLRILKDKQSLFDDVFGDLADADMASTAPHQSTLRELLMEVMREA